MVGMDGQTSGIFATGVVDLQLSLTHAPACATPLSTH